MSARTTILEHRAGALARAIEAMAKYAHCPKCKVLCEVNDNNEMKCPRCGCCHAPQFEFEWDVRKQEFK